MKIMIVDDDKGFIEAAKHFSFDAEIFTFSDPALALEQLASVKPDITIIDVKMPGINGVRFMSIANDIARKSLVIVISANSREDVERDFKSLGTTTFFRKPLKDDFFSFVESSLADLKIKKQKDNVLVNWAEKNLKQAK